MSMDERDRITLSQVSALQTKINELLKANGEVALMWADTETQLNEAVALLQARCKDHDLSIDTPDNLAGGELVYHNVGPTAKSRGHSDNYPEGLWAMCHLTDDERTFLDKLEEARKGS